MLEVGAALHSHAQRCSLRVVPKLTQLQRRRSSGEVVGEGKGVFAACELRKASASLSAEHFRRTDTWYPSWSLTAHGEGLVFAQKVFLASHRGVPTL